MKKFIPVTLALFSALIVLPASNASAWQTREGFIACKTDKSLTELNGFIANGNKTNIEAYISSRKCFHLEKGLTVTIIKVYNKSKIAYLETRDEKFWASIKVIE